jgi:IS5 family transposase
MALRSARLLRGALQLMARRRAATPKWLIRERAALRDQALQRARERGDAWNTALIEALNPAKFAAADGDFCIAYLEGA